MLDIEFVKITPEIDVAGLEPFVAAGAELGARHVITAPYDPDLARLADRLGALCDLAARYGLRAVLEFFPWTVVPDLATALRRGRGQRAEPRPASWSTRCTSTARGSSHAQLDRDPAGAPAVRACLRRAGQDAYTTEELLHAGAAERLPPGEGGIDICGHSPPPAARTSRSRSRCR